MLGVHPSINTGKSLLEIKSGLAILLDSLGHASKQENVSSHVSMLFQTLTFYAFLWIPFG